MGPGRRAEERRMKQAPNPQKNNQTARAHDVCTQRIQNSGQSGVTLVLQLLLPKRVEKEFILKNEVQKC